MLKCVILCIFAFLSSSWALLHVSLQGAVCTERCPEGRFGSNCADECVCHNSGKCDPETGQCKCAEGFTSSRCVCVWFYVVLRKLLSETVTWCLFCGISSHFSWVSLPLFLNSQPLQTKYEIGFGLWLTRETTTLLCLAPHLSCSSVRLCEPLFDSYRCNEECAAGSYGQDCKGVCDCANGARCFNIHGGCLCEPGFSGPHCRERMCASGKYGMHCERTCLCQDKHTLRWAQQLKLSLKQHLRAELKREILSWLSG